MNCKDDCKNWETCPRRELNLPMKAIWHLYDDTLYVEQCKYFKEKEKPNV